MVINEIKKECKLFLQDKIYVVSILVVAMAAYGYQLTHSTAGMDDIDIGVYFDQGLGLSIDRWPFFLLHKLGVSGLAEYQPYLQDFAGVMFLILAAVLWSAAWKVFLGMYGISLAKPCYIIFSVALISYSLISQVWVFFLHNGIAMGYVLTGLAFVFFLEYRQETDKKKKGKAQILLTLFLAIALCFYESLAEVYLFAILFACMVQLYKSEKKEGLICLLKYLGMLAAEMIAAMLFRAGSTKILALIFQIPLEHRNSVSHIVWLFSSDAKATLKNLILETAGYYYALPSYQPIALFIMASLFAMGFVVFYAIKKRNIWLFITGLLAYGSFFSISLLSGAVVYYRAMQVLAVFVGLTAAIFYQKMLHRGRIYRIVSVVLLLVLCWNNLCEINYAFYTEYENYEWTMRIIDTMGNDILRTGYDIDTEPVVLVGALQHEEQLESRGYLSEDSWNYKFIAWAYQKAGVYKERVAPNYYQTINQDLIHWSLDALGGIDSEMLNYFALRGFYFVAPTQDQYNEAKVIAEDMPCYPESGYIIEKDGMIIVNIGVQNEE